MSSLRIMPEKQKNKKGGDQVAGIILLIFSAVIFVCLLSGPVLLGGLGAFIKSFFEGVFGVTAYALSLGGILTGYLLMTKRKITISKRYVWALVFLFISFVFILHLATTAGLLIGSADWGEYIMSCYDVTANSISGGGVIAAVILYPFGKFAGIVGSYILLGVLVFICITVLTNFSIFKLFAGIKRAPKPKKEKIEKAPLKVISNKKEDANALPVYWAKKVPAGGPVYEKEDRPIVKKVSEGDKYFTNLSKSEVPEGREERDNAKAKLYPEKKPITPSFVNQLFNVQNPQDVYNRSYDANSYTKKFEQNANAHKSLFQKFQEDFDERNEMPERREINTNTPPSRRPAVIIHNPSENQGINTGYPQYSLKSQPDEPEAKKQAALKKEPAYPEFFPQKYQPDDEPRAPIINGEDYAKQQFKKQEENIYKSASQKPVEPKSGQMKPVEQIRTPAVPAEEIKPKIFMPAPEAENETEEFIEEILDAEELTGEATPEEMSKAQETAINIIKPILNSTKSVKHEQIGLRIPEEEPILGTKKTKRSRYKAPPVELLNHIEVDPSTFEEDYKANSEKLEELLAEFKIVAKVTGVVCGPTVTRYELQMQQAGTSIKKVIGVADDIAMRMAAVGGIRIEAPIPGRNLFGIEVPNTKKALVSLRSVLESDEFKVNKHLLGFALGKDIGGKNIVQDLADMPHLLVAGSTNTGKSVCLNALIVSLLFKYSPDELRMILVDPKQVEFSVYNEMPHLMLKDVVTTTDKAMNALNWLVGEMERRYMLFKANGVPGIKEYNHKVEEGGEYEKLPRIVLIVDELNDLMMNNKTEVEQRFLRLAQMARAAGIHLVFATQRPSVDVLTGTIKANLPCRIALRVISAHDSKTILDQGGPEKLIGKGDMLLKTGNMSEPLRLQGAFVSLPEVKAVVDYIKEHNDSYFDQSVEKKISKVAEGGYEDDDNSDRDSLFAEALKYVIEAKSASIAMIQRRFGVGYARAGKIVDEMEKMGFISGFEGSKARQILISMDDYNERYGGND